MTAARGGAGPAGRAVLLLAVLGLAGCAALSRGPAPATGEASGGPVAARQAAAAASAPARAVPTRIEVDAPSPLKALLERNLDIARVGVLGGGEAIDDVEWQRLVQATPAQARALLQTEGYFDALVRVVPVPAEPGVRRLSLAVEPGPRTRVSRVTLEAEGELDSGAAAGDPHARQVQTDWRAAWPLQPGAEFRNPAWSDAKQQALARLRAAGYAIATWSGTGAEVDAERHLARLFLVADSGPLFRFGRLQVEGLQRQDLQTVRNLAGFDAGLPLTETRLLDYQERLQKSGLFDSVAVTLDAEPAQAGAAAVQVRLREAPLQVWTFGLGISANTGPRASVEHVHRRVFGFPATARNKVEWGRLRQAWDFEIATHPDEAQYRNLLGGAIERLEGEDDRVLSQRLRLGRSTDTQRIERLAFAEVERSSRTALVDDRQRSDTMALSLNYHGVWRELDSALLPTDGFSVSLQGGVGRSHGSDSASGPFTRLYGRLTAYRPIGSRWYGTARVELGQVVKRSDVAVPDSQLFRAGGDESVRGYGYRSLGPLVDGAVAGGNVLFTASAEVARPISDRLPSLWGAAFVDVGRAARSFRNIDPAVGFGLGVRWRSPVGPLRLDYAWARELQRGRFHFSVGIAF